MCGGKRYLLGYVMWLSSSATLSSLIFMYRCPRSLMHETDSSGRSFPFHLYSFSSFFCTSAFLFYAEVLTVTCFWGPFAIQVFFFFLSYFLCIACFNIVDRPSDRVMIPMNIEIGIHLGVPWTALTYLPNILHMLLWRYKPLKFWCSFSTLVNTCSASIQLWS